MSNHLFSSQQIKQYTVKQKNKKFCIIKGEFSDGAWLLDLIYWTHQIKNLFWWESNILKYAIYKLNTKKHYPYLIITKEKFIFKSFKKY